MRYGLVSDIHSNLAALEAVLTALETEGAIDGLLCMGDIVGYGPQPNEVIQRLKEYELFAIVGNHDLGVIGRLDLGDFNYDAVVSNRWNQEQLAPENREWLEELKPLARFNDNVTLAHGSPREPVWEYLTTPQAAARSFAKFETPLCFVGHTHLPRVFRLKPNPISLDALPLVQMLLKSNLHDPRVDMLIPVEDQVFALQTDRIILNPGSVGQPRDSDNRASFAIYDDDAKTVTFKRAAYDIGRTQRLMQDYNLPPRLAQRLEFGV